MMTGWTKTARSTLLLVGIGALLGLGMSLAEPGPLMSASMAAYGSLAAIVLLGGWIIWKVMGSDARLGRMAVIAFALRLGVGIALSLLLPVIGANNEPNNAGYIFYDAYLRDSQAWDLAQPGQSLISAFDPEFYSDQYGGMLMMSAGIYRVFSPDMHRPWLILLITASVYALGVIFLYKALVSRFGEKTAILASWIYLLYPETIFLGAAQMRDPILIGLTAGAFYVVETWRELRWKSAAWLVVLLGLVALFSWPVALAVGALLAVWWWVDYSATLADRRKRLMGWAFLALIGITAVTMFSRWLRLYAAYDISEAIRNSGWIDYLFESLPEVFQTPFIVIYGLLQPVLPAAIFDPSIPVSTTIVTLRSLGWYLIFPLLLYTPFALWKMHPGIQRRILGSTLAIVTAWIAISSLRAGGDVWDNPRYRTLLLPWIALIAAWAWNYAKLNRDRWLARLYLVTGIFVIFFSNWYVRRNYGGGIHMEFWVMIAWIAGLSLLVLGEGFLEEFLRHRKSRRMAKKP